ncbi:MAG: hypothetical protein AB8G77_28680 [Rhodothermales bacterium]
MEATYLQVSKIRISDTDTPHPNTSNSSNAKSPYQATVYVGLLLKDLQLKDDLSTHLNAFIRMIPVVEVVANSSDNIEEDPAEETGEHTSVRAQDVFLVSDWSREALEALYPAKRFASVMMLGVGAAQTSGVLAGAEDDYCYLEEDDVEQLCEEIVLEVQSRLFPSFEEKRLALHTQNRQQHEFLDHIGRELSVFYHNINNPLTILSGNIQLLQLLADSMQISADIMKPISDIAVVSGRFEQDLKSIAELKEKIRAEGLQNE